jgi:hypothetical protein
MIVFNVNIFIVLYFGGKLLCELRWGLLVLYAAVDAYLAAFALLAMPETKGLSLQAVQELLARHRLWRHVVGGGATTTAAAAADSAASRAELAAKDAKDLMRQASFC